MHYLLNLFSSAVHKYERLRDSNVTGTVEILRFCAATKRKMLEFISSTSALDGILEKSAADSPEARESISENTDLWQQTHKLPYLNGYR